ncbi:hypothetical protein FB446DRAFT_769143 [Lentinula raphanica]|nr:hypothetical protein FB446DRAFT_769143 [Lentinula raphanica]
MEIDHYYTQRDILSTPPRASSTPVRNAGKIRIPPLDFIRQPGSIFCDLPGSDDEPEGHGEDDAQQFLDSLEFDPHDMMIPIPKPRKIAGTRRVVSAQNARMTVGKSVGLTAGKQDSTGSAAPLPTPESFQSITATRNLTGTSFEELRAECYAQSRIATGAPPAPSTPISIDAYGMFQPARSIPPQFQPSVIEHKSHAYATTYPDDVEMSDV